MTMYPADIARTTADRANSDQAQLDKLGSRVQTAAAAGAYELELDGPLPASLRKEVTAAGYKVTTRGTGENKTHIITWGN